MDLSLLRPAPAHPVIRKELLISVMLFIILIGGWETLVRLLHVSPLSVPPPSMVAQSMVQMLSTMEFWHAATITLYETLTGFAFGATIGLLLGACIGQFEIVERTVYPYIVAFQAMPKVAIAPLLVIWFGYGVESKIVITATIAFFPVLANTIVGLQSVPQEQIDMLRSFTASEWRIFRMVKIPYALPHIFAGIDISIVLAVIGAVVGEFVGSQAGLGNMILQRNFSMDVSGSFAIVIVLSVIGVSLHVVVDLVRNRTVFWTKSRHRDSFVA